MIKKLPFHRREKWDDGTFIRWYTHPFEVRRTLHLGKHDFTVKPVPLDRVVGSQHYVTDRGVEKWLFADAAKDVGDMPYVYEEDDGTFTIGDGHHRFVAAYLRRDKTLLARVGRPRTVV